MNESIATLHPIEGQRVSIALRNGARFDKCDVVSRTRGRNRTLWLVVDDEDVFVPVADVVGITSMSEPPTAA
jgi:hypothetical protein